MARRSVATRTALADGPVHIPGHADAWLCPGCQHRCIRVQTPDGERVLDTDVETWVLAVVGAEGVSTYYRSRGYPVHQETCGRAQ